MPQRKSKNSTPYDLLKVVVKVPVGKRKELEKHIIEVCGIEQVVYDHKKWSRPIS